MALFHKPAPFKGGFMRHKKEFGIYHWDTFDNTTSLIAEADTLEEAKSKLKEEYKDRIKIDGADKAEIVDSKGNVVKAYKVG